MKRMKRRFGGGYLVEREVLDFLRGEKLNRETLKGLEKRIEDKLQEKTHRVQKRESLDTLPEIKKVQKEENKLVIQTE